MSIKHFLVISCLKIREADNNDLRGSPRGWLQHINGINVLSSQKTCAW